MRDDQAKILRQQLRELAGSPVDMRPETRLEVAREAVRDDFAYAWKDNNVQAFVTTAAAFSQIVVDICDANPELTSILASLALHDGDTFSHISNVGTYTAILARKLGISKDHGLRAIVQAGLLHDLGKRWVCKDILKKPGKLTLAERQVMSDHPRRGFVEICQCTEFSAEQLLMVYQHHEKLDGTGYPTRLVGDEICWTAKLCAVVDVFDALTARRSYRTPTGPEQAIEIIQQGTGTQFCPEYVRCWVELAGDIELSLTL
jgi:HD-GYP domain-containing protein (c-di-GMP phosphodiesterase class II)